MVLTPVLQYIYFITIPSIATILICFNLRPQWIRYVAVGVIIACVVGLRVFIGI